MTTTTAVGPATGLTDVELAVIEGRLHVSGLFTAHAHTDMTRLIAEVHRLRQTLAAQPAGEATASRPASTREGAPR